MTRIEWTEKTWNVTTGCTKLSPGCKHCYAEAMARRLQAMGAPGYENGFKLSLMPARLEQPLHRRKTTLWFVNSMSDLFHEDRVFRAVPPGSVILGQEAEWATIRHSNGKGTALSEGAKCKRRSLTMNLPSYSDGIGRMVDQSGFHP